MEKDNSEAWKALAQRATRKIAERTRQVKDLEAALLEMRERLTKAEDERDAVSESAHKTIQGLEERLERIKAQAQRWHHGLVGAMPAVAGILAEFRGFTLPDNRHWERWQELRIAELESQLRAARQKETCEF